MEERRLRRVEIFRLCLLLERAAAEGDDPPAQVRDRKHHAIAEAVVGHRDVLASNQQAGFHHVLGRNALLAEVLLEREAIGRSIAQAELELGRGIERTIGEVAARFGAQPRRQRRFEEFRREFDDVVERLAALVAHLLGAVDLGQFHARLRSQPLHRFGERQALGQHQEIENGAVLAGGKIEPRHLLVIDEERRRLLLVEGRKPPPFAPGFLELHAPADDLRDREARAQLVEELGRKTHATSA